MKLLFENGQEQLDGMCNTFRVRLDSGDELLLTADQDRLFVMPTQRGEVISVRPGSLFSIVLKVEARRWTPS